MKLHVRHAICLLAPHALLAGCGLFDKTDPEPEVAPDAPTIGVATPANGQVSITFTAPSVTGSAAITQYTATCTGLSGSHSASAAQSPITVTGLTNGVLYSCSVTATNSVGTSPASAIVEVAPSTVPGAPTIGTATAGNATAVVAFTAPVSDGGSPITSYTVTCSASSGSSRSASGPASPLTVTSMTNGAAYNCVAQATNARGSSVASSTVSVTPFTVPSAPIVGAATPVDGGASVAFTVPASNGGSAITGYTAMCTANGQTTRTGSAATSPISVTAMTNGVSYSCSVIATNAAGDSPASPTVNVTPAAPPGAPSIGTVTSGNGSASVAFTAPASNGGSAITGYTATCTASGQTTRTGTGASSPITVSNLTNGIQYQCNVKATNAAGTGAASADGAVTPLGPPGAPTALAATAGNAEATISFTAPASTGGSAITGYTVTCTASGQTTRTATGAGSPLTVTTMTNGSLYTCTATATNAAGTGAASLGTTVTPRTVPGAPTNLVATPGNAGATLTFTAPASNGGATITKYTASCHVGPSVPVTKDSTATTIKVTGLTNDELYECSVFATNAAGAGASTSEAQVTPTASAGPVNTSSVYCSYTWNQNNATLGFNSYVQYTCNSTQRTMKSNQVPDHTPGTFPNGGNPHAISAQSSGPIFTSGFATPLEVQISNSSGTAVAHTLGFALNGVKFDPATAETCPEKSYCPSGFTASFNVEALGQNLFSAGVDNSNAHVQPNGAYHYHGIPQGYMDYLAPGQSTGQQMIFVGFAIDGFPVYSKYGYTNALDMTSAIKTVTSSWQLKASPSTGRVSFGTVANGTFTQDWEYVANSGDLDQCNGRYGKTPEFPNGIYHYYITSTFPYIQRCVKGTYLSLP
jgi:hypothetical protein